MKPYDMNTFINRYNIFILFVILVFASLLRLPTLFEPWGGDQGVYGYIAKGLLEGKVPYRDMYSSTGYGIFFIYALLYKLFGTNMAALHIGDFLSILLTVGLVYFITCRLYGRRSATLAAILTALFASGSAFSGMYDLRGAWGTYWQLAQRETFMLPIFTSAIIIMILADQKQKCHPYFWVGILIGMAAIIKFTAILMAFFLLLYVFYAEVFRSDGDGIRIFILKSILAVSGFVIIQIPFLFYFWINDSLQIMYNAVFVHTSIYAGLSRGNIIASAFQGNTFIIRENLILWLFTPVTVLYLLYKDKKREDMLLVIWALGTILMVWGQGKFFGYHYILIIAPFSILTGLGIVQFLNIKPGWWASIWAARKNLTLIFLWILIAGNLLAFFIINYDYYKWHALYLSDNISKEQYYEVFNEYPLHLYSFRADNDVASYLKTHGKKNDKIRTINGGGDTIIQFLTGTELSTRFTSTWYLFNPGLYHNPLTGKLRKELIEEIKSEQPEYILLIFYNMEEFREQYNGPDFEDITALMDYINENYILEKSFSDRRTLYKRI